MDQNFSTKHDLEKTKNELKHELTSLKTEVKRDIIELRKDMHFGFEKLESKLTIKLGSLLVLAIGIMQTLKVLQ